MLLCNVGCECRNGDHTGSHTEGIHCGSWPVGRKGVKFYIYSSTSQFLSTTFQLLLFHNSTASHTRLITLGSLVSQPAFTITSAFKGTFCRTLLVPVIRRLSDHGSISMFQTKFYSHYLLFNKGYPKLLQQKLYKGAETGSRAKFDKETIAGVYRRPKWVPHYST
jgi:hypothetical protein